MSVRPIGNRLWIYWFLAFFLAVMAWQVIYHSGVPLTLPFGLERLFTTHDVFSEDLIKLSLEHYAEGGDRDIGGFMLAFEPEIHIAATKYLLGPGPERTHYPYVSNFGAQYTFLKFLTFGNPNLVGFAYVCGVILASLGMAFVVATLTEFARQSHSLTHAYALFFVFALSPPILERSASPYWFSFVYFLPFLATLVLYPGMREGAGFRRLLAVIAALVALKCLMGFEYLPAIALGAAIPVAYYEIVSAARMDGALAQRVFVRFVVIGVATVAGFVLAAGALVLKAGAYLGDLGKGVEALTLPFSYTFLPVDTGIRNSLEVTWTNVVAAWRWTLFLRNAHINAPLWIGLLGAGSLMFLYRHRLADAIAERSRTLVALLVITLIGGFGAATWSLIALRHILYHNHLNWITTYLFFTPLAALLLVEISKTLSQGLRAPKPVTPSTGP